LDKHPKAAVTVLGVPARVDYERHGLTYAQHRRPDPRIAQRIHAALGDAQTVLNVGAGAGSYEPTDRWLLAVPERTANDPGYGRAWWSRAAQSDP
jgi:hypothetical protein